MHHLALRLAPLAAVASSLFLSACASAPDTAPRAEAVAEPVTGTNIPRRDRSKPVSGVTVLSGDAVKEALGKPQVPSEAGAGR
jgi:hypothetical protein